MIEVQFIFFIVTSLVLIITPGQDMILVMSRSITQGSKAGIVTAAGVCTGLLGHTVLASFGLGAILQASKTLFTIVKIIGSSYLFYLGIKYLLSKQNHIEIKKLNNISLKRLFFQGAFSNISNPKIAIFFFAYLPQFIPQNTSNFTFTLLILGIIFTLLTFIIKGIIGYTAGILSNYLKSKPKVQLWINKISGIVLIGLSFKLAFERRN
jgi:threonine/homoserine/homoserine lactone efflux protein